MTELNGVELTDLESAAEALDHLNDDYNDGDLVWAEGGNCLIVMCRTARFQHWQTFRDSERLDLYPSAVKKEVDDSIRPRLKVEIRETDRWATT